MKKEKVISFFTSILKLLDLWFLSYVQLVHIPLLTSHARQGRDGSLSGMGLALVDLASAFKLQPAKCPSAELSRS